MKPQKKDGKKSNRSNDTKARILEAARHFFTQQGFSGTSIADIADLAQVNTSLIFHHFGNKQGLWEAVKGAIATKAQAHDQIAPALTLSLREFIYTLLQDRVRLYQSDPELLQMMNWQRIEKNNKDIGVTHNPRIQVWLDAFTHYKDQGQIDPKHKPEFIVTMVIAIAAHAAFDPNVFVKTEKDLQDYLSFCADIIFSGLKN